MSRFIISCGGTGGHLSPGIALAEGLTGRGHEVILLISKKRVDARLIEKYPQFTFQAVPGSGFSWNPVKLIQCMTSQFNGLLFSLRLVRQQKPDGIVAFGGFTSAGIAMAGWLGRMPVALHESNRVPGLAVRVLGGLARRVYLSPGVKLTSVRARHIRFVGMPVRKEIQPLSQAVARETLGLDPNRAVLVVFGGSQGAGPLNDWVREQLRALSSEGIQVYCVTGVGKGEPETITLPVLTGGEIRAIFVPFCDQVASLLSCADLVLSRAGAGTIAELIRCATPAILVPLPTAADDHQSANAAFFEKQGGGLVVEQSRLPQMRAEVLDTIFNDWLLARFHSNLQRMDRANPLDIMLDDLEMFVAPPDSELAEPKQAAAS
ncbi:MAG: UDP-N-acetylglucosamine--N-acetylmuramyl-(pentapeptide) pyrophosphoryl-undecaprenol N-acetylglucosamine transferase [Opitutaceae bacterium]|nr:UDP-N-acetylglucosamine--N-acetylmuramyl-(pentapeptide) pyrophosphoryl-undecaprenol N-acetylglucosamine transferase [Opitutaceae bacterium]|tara:strand:+ start:3118 stop:4248 length:1131 start_codon:yes stop_codon:yes gene_type:complete